MLRPLALALLLAAALPAAEVAAQATAQQRGRQQQAFPRLVAPVPGAVVQRFGQADDLGIVARGHTYEAPRGARVLAPAAGSVMFAGPLAGHGLILIVEHAGGYHSLVAGLVRIDVRVGQRVTQGQAVGQMDQRGDGRPRLYFEFRQAGQPVDPQRGLPASDGRGQG